MKIQTTILAACLLSTTLLAQRGSDRTTGQLLTSLKSEGFDNSKVMETLFQLTDVCGPRLTGSTGLARAQQWAKTQLQEWGLQGVKLERWGGFGRGWETERCYVAMTAPYYQPLIAVPKAWTPGTNGLIASEVVLLNAARLEDLQKYEDKVRGKIVLLAPESTDMRPGFKPDARRLTAEELDKLAADPRMDDPGENVSGGPTREQRRELARFRQKADSFLLARGALALLTSNRGSMGTVFTSNGASFSWNAKPVLPGLEMSAEDLNRLTRLLRAEKNVRLEIDVKNTFLQADSSAFNVIAEIPGTDKKLASELVMLGAHIDSWHGATGATDNAAGVAVMMEAVRILKALGLQPRRTIRIALWSGEEQGILGSKGYVREHFGDASTMALKPAHSRISAYYNLDNGAGRIRGIYLQSNDAVRPIFEKWMAPFADLGATTVTIRNTGATDHIPFDAIGIPGFQFIQDPLEYGSRTHHTNMDTYDRVNKADLMQASVIVAYFVYNTAMRDELLPRKPLPKVKKV